MSKRDIFIAALEFKAVDIVPHNFHFTRKAADKLAGHYGGDWPGILDNYMLSVEAGVQGSFREIEPDIRRDEWGVEWDMSIDKDIGTPRNIVFEEPDMKYWNPPAVEGRCESVREAATGNSGELFFMSGFGFSLFERAWTLRGMENLMMDFILNPGFVNELLDALCDWNLEVIRRIIRVPGVDGLRFGDDWGSQQGLLMGPDIWMEFIRPRLSRMYSAVRESGRYLMIHSCGKVQELFPELIELGLNLFDPFQPEVMDVREMHETYFGRLAFHGGVSVQKTLPYGSSEDVRREVADRWKMGRRGGYVLAPSHSVPGDAPLENLTTMIETVREYEA